MELITGTLLASLVAIWSVYYFSEKKRKLRRIPGPSGYPIIGNGLQMDQKRPHETLRKWAKQYGDVMKISLFGEDIVVANGPKEIHELMLKKSNDFAGRPHSYRRDVIYHGIDMVFSDMGPKWGYMKKASMTGLKQVGDQVSNLDDILQGYLEDVIQHLAKFDEKVIDMQDAIYRFVYKVTYTLIYGREISVAELETFVKLNNTVVELFAPTSEYATLDALPFLRGFWYGKYRTYTKTVNETRDMYKRYTETSITNHRQDETNCILDSMIGEMKAPSVDKALALNFEDVVGAAIDLVAAGVTTTAHSFYFFISLMATNQELQNEARDHILEVIGDRPPTLNDRFTIPYVEAMIIELLRLMSHVPVAVPHKTLVDTSLKGYDIPKGTQVWPNLWSLHHDEHLWEDPWEFKPKRFLDEDGKMVKADHPLRKQFYAFGAGRRVCAGESLAKHRMFLFMVSMLQNFNFSKPKNEKIVTDPRTFILGVILRPFNYNVHIERRQ